MTDTLTMARLLQLCSPALPVGAYAYSQAMESAIDERWVSDDQSAEAWITGVFNDGFMTLDGVALVLAALAWQRQDGSTVRRLDQYLSASRETSELLLEDKQMGRSLARLLRSLGLVIPDSDEPSYATVFGCAGACWQIPVSDLLGGFAFSWLENQVTIATKTVPLGQTAAQQMLARLAALIEPAVSRTVELAHDQSGLTLDDWCFGDSLPALAILSSRHETLESRLYRS